MNEFSRSSQAAGSRQNDIGLVRYFDVVLANRWLVLAIASTVLLLGVAYSFLARPVYQSDIVVQVEQENPTNAKSLLGDVSSLFDVKTETSAQIEVLRSRMVVGNAVDKLKLYIRAEPVRFPLIGSWIARWNKGLSRPGLFGMGGYAWAGESIDVDVFDVPDDLEGESFRLIALGNGRFRVEQKFLDTPIEGRVGETVVSGGSNGPITLRVQSLHANPGTEFVLVRNSRLKTMENLQDKLFILEKGKQSGIIDVSLTGNDRHLTAQILNNLGDEYVAANIARKAAEAEKSLAFLSDLLPQLKRELESSEATYNALRVKRGTFDLSEEGKTYLKESVDLQTNLLALKQKRMELSGHFTSEYPAVRAVDEQIAALSAKAAAVSGKMTALPELEQESLRLMRDVRVNNDLYVGMLNNMQQLKLVRAGKVGTVRLLDRAVVPKEPIKPNKPLLIGASAVLGLVLGVLAAFIRQVVRRGVTDPQDIEHETGLSVYATVPVSRTQAALTLDAPARDDSLLLLAQHAPADPSVESLRSLRLALQLSIQESGSNRVLLTGPSERIGKSFLCANLAAVMTGTDKRVLLIDGDLRKGHLHRYFGKQAQPGLADVLTSRVTLDQALQRNVAPGLDFLANGKIPPNPAELLMSDQMSALLDSVGDSYDVVLIDTPPVLPVSDAAILAHRCGTVLLVARFGTTSVDEVRESAKQLRQANVELKGVIFNGFDPSAYRYSLGSTALRSRYGSYRYASASDDKASAS
ncbi:polysaccharide biosynthesis tyrosine autokinase [Paraburkholderia sp. MMS20-SJTR3]|uniref:Polysaccharide biosynthesis tyrosine autokinase n=1 Tax=Paraburkholderia sejongensis TaxID=2886946 RepID=A0ABS8JSB0_9BURK|nr:polysaccharide biosynthesis tyrosine autokinase [Paraburkholderia sp. MMS20-SJTR3]MCC8392608.1 polysaccharide biosynthesis tyrosine autokinase [Paraburkholderia sp. MMS20-SJTR3]